MLSSLDKATLIEIPLDIARKRLNYVENILSVFMMNL